MIVFVIPAYNEAQNILNLLNKTHEMMLREKMPFRIIIVNDGSTDDTVKLAESLKDRMPIEIYSHYPNKGVGEAFRVGFRRALQICEDGDIVVTKEADNTSDLTILQQMISKINDGNDVVLASCYAKEGGIIGTTLFRLMLSRCANLLFKQFIPIKRINTYTSFYRAYSSTALRQIYNLYRDKLIEQNGFECVVELLIKFSRNKKFKIEEVPMVLYGDRRIGKSKMRVFKTIKGVLKVILKEGLIYRIRNIKNDNRKR